MSKLLGAVAALALAVLPATVQAATITQAGNTLYVLGQIAVGDVATMFNTLKDAPGKLPATTVSLQSPGGSVTDAAMMADIIRSRHLAVTVPDGAMCASACFLLFAAGEPRTIGQGVRIGVHSARLSDKTFDDGAGTLFMARTAAKLGAPASIVGRMVETESVGMDWLTEQDLAGMVTAGLAPAAAPSVNLGNTYARHDAAPATLAAALAPKTFSATTQPNRPFDLHDIEMLVKGKR